MAAWAASIARRLPVRSPMDIIVLPACSITARTSLKSRLISPGDSDEIGDALDSVAEHVVGEGKGVFDGHGGAGHLMQALVGNHDQRIHVLAQRREALFGYALPAGAFEGERQRHHRHGQRRRLPRQVGDHRSGAGAGTAAETGGDEHQMSTAQHRFETGFAFLGRSLTEVRIAAGAPGAGSPPPDLHLGQRLALTECLGIGVDCDEAHATQPGFDHPPDGVNAGTPDADDADFRESFPGRRRVGTTENLGDDRIERPYRLETFGTKGGALLFRHSNLPY